MAFSAQGATFTFSGARCQLGAHITALTVNSPSAEVVDMTGVSHALGVRMLVPTGDLTGGTVDVEYIASAGVDVDPYVSDYGTLTFGSPSMTITRRAVLSSAEKQVRVGDIVRGTLKFTLTDYAG